MANLIVVGSIGLDTINTAEERMEEVIGGTAAYFALGASFFTKVGVISIVGSDFPWQYIDMLRDSGADIEGIERKDGRTYRWEGRYEKNMDKRTDVSTEVNVLGEFNPAVPESYKGAGFVFLGNTDPAQHMRVLQQLSRPQFVGLDTIKFWMDNKLEELMEVVKLVDIVFLNEDEARQLFGEQNLKKAAMKCLDLGPSYIVIKKGGHGALLFSRGGHFSVPGYPLEKVEDPTGAGDSFAGGFMGWVARTGDASEANLRKAMVYGSVIASFNTQEMGPYMLKKINMEDIQKRYNEFKRFVEF